ncbi:hypothetical protein [Streptomyces sp. NPDC059957]|uniref:hypothetical protein n=1 Tax=unclassified Streptomyces TaxID=2593676 RepID=UPI003656CCE1
MRTPVLAAVTAVALKNGISESLAVMENASATEVQADVNVRRAKCGTDKAHLSEEEIKNSVAALSSVPEKNIRAHIAAKAKAADTFICKN